MTSSATPFLVVVNPRAGAGRARAQLPAVERALAECGASYTVALTAGPADATRIVKAALRRGTPGVAVVGGDGTMNEAVNGFFDDNGKSVAPEAWLGPLPCGTGGDFRRTVGLSSDPAVMVTHLMWSEPRPIDVGTVEFRAQDGSSARRTFLNIASFGLSGVVDQLVNAGPKWIGGKAAFLAGAVRAAASFKSRRVRLTIDDGPTDELDIINVAVANGRFFGGGMQIASQATLDDGLFDVVTIEAMRFTKLLALAPDIYRGTAHAQKGIRYLRGARVRAEPADWAGPILLDVDGEAPGSLPATFEIRPGVMLLRG